MSKEKSYKAKQRRLREVRCIAGLIQSGADDLVALVARGELTPEQAWTRYRKAEGGKPMRTPAISQGKDAR